MITGNADHFLNVVMARQCADPAAVFQGVRVAKLGRRIRDAVQINYQDAIAAPKGDNVIVGRCTVEPGAGFAVAFLERECAVGEIVALDLAGQGGVGDRGIAVGNEQFAIRKFGNAVHVVVQIQGGFGGSSSQRLVGEHGDFGAGGV